MMSINAATELKSQFKYSEFSMLEASDFKVVTKHFRKPPWGLEIFQPVS